MRAIAVALVLSAGLLDRAGGQIVAPPCPNCQRIFDSRTWDGWEHDPQNWTVVDGAMRGFGSGARSAFTKTGYGSFRLANLESGTLRVAVDGKEIVRYTDKDPKRLSRGPIGMQHHGAGGSEYKDIFVEADPKENTLYTVR